MPEFEPLDKTFSYFPDAHSMAMATNGAERLRIDSAGNIRIGETAGLNARLTVQGETNDDKKFALKVTDLQERDLLSIRNDGFVGIGTSEPGALLEVKGGAFQHTGSYDAIFTSEGAANKLIYIASSGEAKLGFKNPHNLAIKWALGVAADGKFYLADNVGLTVSPRLVIDTSGNVGIGTTNIGRPLTIRGTGTGQELIAFEDPNGVGKWHINQNLDGNKPGLNFVETNVSDGRIFIKAGGYVGIGNTNPNYKLDVSGEIHATNFPSTSDIRLKTDIKPLNRVLQKLEKIHGVSFEWNNLSQSFGHPTKRREIGLIAQEVESVFPELVTSRGDEGYKAIDYSRMAGVIIEAVKELKVEMDALTKKIDALSLPKMDCKSA